MVALGQAGDPHGAAEFFRKMPEHGLVPSTAIVTAFAQNGRSADAKEHSVVSWTAMIVALSQHKLLSEARAVFDSMPEKNIVSWTALLQAYALGMDVDRALSLFEEMPERNLVSWNSMLGACAQSGEFQLAIETFHRMLLDGSRPNEISFTIVLGACSHGGCLDKGRDYFSSMVVDHGVQHEKEHYYAMVDVLGRAGRLSKAEELIKTMPFVPESAQYEVLLGASTVQRNAQFGGRAAEGLIALDPGNSSPYVLLANIHASTGNREQVAALWEAMKDKGVRKPPGMSLPVDV
ncbi:pentatricopeptide repeat-containing protein At4g02750-like [Selaginella moellendorffii]|uniref:pentatricopeptide repeat-containing protein At4g02750-like n=1 Tax=Selaginella moellendorffii TaxID=88036 RepID=UPI000D1C2F15|nr:pentatricopeptide repeat-containing protein At4g02750-like [Selaginella moellendorffii]|eukprot:XP_024529137.1 pentatricopeptide repeat-containing protein At4g02750-like [Selaginella moellendorffii]